MLKIQRKKLERELFGLGLDCSTGHGTEEKFQRLTELTYLLERIWIKKK